ncbi:hypothetical protein ACOSQ3_016302 [Xanthoceras sorbifolium]
MPTSPEPLTLWFFYLIFPPLLSYFSRHQLSLSGLCSAESALWFLSTAAASLASRHLSLLPEDDHTIATLLAAEENSKTDGRLGKRLSHLDSIPTS